MRLQLLPQSSSFSQILKLSGFLQNSQIGCQMSNIDIDLGKKIKHKKLILKKQIKMKIY